MTGIVAVDRASQTCVPGTTSILNVEFEPVKTTADPNNEPKVS
jgi:hypothetical protein